MSIQQILEKLGFSKKEVLVYTILLANKKISATKISELSGINRTTTYDVLNSLNKKGLVLKLNENKKTVFAVDSPKSLGTWLRNQEKKVADQKKFLEENLPQINYFFNATATVPTIRYFEGNDRIEEFFDHSLETNPDEIIGYSTTPSVITMFDEKYIKKYSKKRCALNIRGRYIVRNQDKESTIKYMKNYYQPYIKNGNTTIQCGIMPKSEKQVLSETLIYNNTVAISHMEHQFFGVMIESKTIADSQRTIFNALWKTIKVKISLPKKTSQSSA